MSALVRDAGQLRTRTLRGGWLAALVCIVFGHSSAPVCRRCKRKAAV